MSDSGQRSVRALLFSLSLLLVLCVLLVFVSCTPAIPGAGSRDNERDSESIRKDADKGHSVAKRALAPWQLWRTDSLGNKNLADAEELIKLGALEGAVDAYLLAQRNAGSKEVRDEAFLRRTGTLLKLGQSRTVLDEITRSLRAQKKSMTDLRPELALIVAFAYQHLGNVDQTLAWFGVVRKNSVSSGGTVRLAAAETGRYLRGLSKSEFDKASQRWLSDSFIGPLFSRERLRRARGGRPESASEPAWFSPDTYRRRVVKESLVEPDDPEVEPEPETASSDVPEYNVSVIGIMLPLTGRFALHAARVRRGIELALEEAKAEGRVRIVVVDTSGDSLIAAGQYGRLAERDRASVVLGPLLVRTTEKVAEKSRKVHLPFISFTKRESIASLGESVFRLGATAESQTRELASYAVEELGGREFSILRPNTHMGKEFAESFRKEVERLGGTIAGEVGCEMGEESSVERAIDKLSQKVPDALFIPETLERALLVLENLQASALSEVLLLGPALWDDPIALRGYGTLVKKAIYVTPFYAKSPRTSVEEFVRAYKERFDEEPDLLAAQAYDAARLVLQALEKKPVGHENMIRTLQSGKSFQGVTGRLSVARDGEIVRRMSVLKLEDGEVVEVMSAGVAKSYL